MVSLRKVCTRSLVCAAALLAVCGSATATDLSSGNFSVSLSDPTQLGRLSRNNVPQDWSGGEAFPGLINLTTTYHYHAFDFDLGSLEAPYGSYGQYVEVIFNSPSANTFLSAYLDSYDPANKSANWLGDLGLSGLFFGTDPLFMDVVVPAGHHLELVLNNTASGNVGVGDVGAFLVSAFCDTQYTDLGQCVSAVPEPGTVELALLGLALAGARRLSGGRRSKAKG